MSTDIRPEVSKKREYWIPKHRYYELKHFVMQYPDWEQYLKDTNSLVKVTPPDSDKVDTGSISDPVLEAVIKRDQYATYMNMVGRVAQKTHPVFGTNIVHNIINDMAYKDTTNGVLMSRNEYYNLYRRFFWLLDQERG